MSDNRPTGQVGQEQGWWESTGEMDECPELPSAGQTAWLGQWNCDLRCPILCTPEGSSVLRSDIKLEAKGGREGREGGRQAYLPPGPVVSLGWSGWTVGTLGLVGLSGNVLGC